VNGPDRRCLDVAVTDGLSIGLPIRMTTIVSLPHGKPGGATCCGTTAIAGAASRFRLDGWAGAKDRARSCPRLVWSILPGPDCPFRSLGREWPAQRAPAFSHHRRAGPGAASASAVPGESNGNVCGVLIGTTPSECVVGTVPARPPRRNSMVRPFHHRLGIAKPPTRMAFSPNRWVGRRAARAALSNALFLIISAQYRWCVRYRSSG